MITSGLFPVFQYIFKVDKCKWTALTLLSRAPLHSGVWVFPVSRAVAHRLYHVTRKGNLFWFETEALCRLSRSVLGLSRSPRLLPNKLRGCFFSFSNGPVVSVTHPARSFPPPSGTTETPGRRQPLQRPITPLIAYQIQFGIAVNEAKCSLLCVSACVHTLVCVCVLLCEAWRSVLPLSSPISGIETPNCRAPTRLPSKIFLCLSNQALTLYTHTHTHTALDFLVDACAHLQAHHCIQYCWLTLWNIKWKERKSIQLLCWEME